MPLENLAALMVPHGAEARRMFGGTAFMLNGNLAIGTRQKTGLIVRVGPEATAAVIALGARQMVMGARELKGWAFVDAATDLAPWVDLAPAFNRTLPPEAAKKRSWKA